MGISRRRLKWFLSVSWTEYFVQGTGLGLAICRVIVEKLVERLLRNPNWMKVLLFVLRFLIRGKNVRNPKRLRSVRNQYGTEKSIAKKNSTGGGRCRQQLFCWLKTLLGKRCNLLWAKEWRDAVNQFKEHQPDLILMDIKMPHMDGLEATRLVCSYSKECLLSLWLPFLGLTKTGL